MDTKWILKYLTDLSEHNNREWYHAHKAENKEANAQFEELIQTLILRIGEFDTSILHNQPKELTFKLVRDTRFSHDKSPYNPSFRAHIASKGKLPVPVGYYLMIKPGGQSFLGGGLFADMFKDATAMIRDYITEHGEEFEEIIHTPEFQKYFRVQGTSLKNVPAGYDKEHPLAEKAICCLAQRAAECKSFYTEDMKVNPCIGCNACWLKTPGICAVKDDYEQILKAYLQYDVTVFISDTALGFVDYKMKNVIDRILPMATMYTRIEDGQTRHVPRYKKEFRFGLLYAGNGNQAYLTHWMSRFCLNFHGISLGAFPIEAWQEVAVCML